MNSVQLQLNVPFASKDQAKSLGARWNPKARCWYVPHGLDIQLFKLWWPEGLDAAPSSTATPGPKAVQRTAGAVPVFTGPDSVAADPSSKLPWED